MAGCILNEIGFGRNEKHGGGWWFKYAIAFPEGRIYDKRDGSRAPLFVRSQEDLSFPRYRGEWSREGYYGDTVYLLHGILPICCTI